MPTARFAQLSRLRLEYFEHGHGPARVVLVHGFEASARIWTAVQEALPPELYTSIAINNRGAGNSDAPSADEDYGVQHFAADAHELVAGLDWQGYTLVGHSMGGATVVQYAADHPEDIAGLVMLDPANPDGRPGTAQQMQARVEAFLITRKARLDAAANSAPQGGASATRSDAAADWRTLLEADMARAPECRLRGSLRSMHGIRLGHRLASLPMPVLLACGDQDELISVPDMLDTWKRLPAGSGLQVWHGIGHSPNLECPLALTEVLRQFIEKRVAGAQAPRAVRD